MKINKFTSALVALGVVSLAGVAQANTTVYLTGSTAARQFVFNALTTSGAVFTGAGAVVSAAPNNVGSANLFVVEGNIAGVGTVDINCSFTGSEAGIASVAQAPLVQSLAQNPAVPGLPAGTHNYALPGVPPSFLVGPGYTATAPVSNPDLSMADTSQAVSQTPQALYHLTDYGIVGVVPFTSMKGYEATPDQSWSDLNNVTTAQLAINSSGAVTANYYTGNAADADAVVIVGRNLGSGTKANFALNGCNFATVNSPVDQFAYDCTYTAAGVLTKGSNYGAGLPIQEVFNDGFDSGSGVQKVMNVDGTGSGVVAIGYMGISDAKNAATAPAAAGHAATYLKYNGVYESDAAVENGNYTWWGSEHLLGAVGQVPGSGAAGITGNAIVHGIGVALVSQGNATGDVSTNPAQSPIIPTSLMAVTRASNDSGYPTQGSF
jgi:hypothetical protein